jgi:RAB protein geranylgeranyltransferase component A
MSGFDLEETQYDAIVLGTGLTNTIVASAIAKAGGTLLHLDRNAEYGAQLATHNLKAFVEFLEQHAGPLGSGSNASASDDVSEDQQQKWKAISKDEGGNFEYRSVRAQPQFFNATFVDFTTQAVAPEETPAAPAANAEDAHAAAADANTASVASPSLPEKRPSSLLSESRRYAIDINPHLLFSRSPMIDVLVSSGIHHYLEFKAVDAAYFAHGGTATSASDPAVSIALHPLPLSKSSIFQSSSLSMLEKRVLMKFVHLCLGDDYHSSTAALSAQAAAVEQAHQRPFIEFLKENKLSPQLQQMILYAISMFEQNDQNFVNKITTEEGLYRLRAYLASVGRYGPGAFLVPNYGISELPQAFSRLAAVNRGIYMLRYAPEAIVYEKPAPNVEESKDASASSSSSSSETTRPQRRYKGIITSSGQFLTSSALLAGAEYSLDAALESSLVHVFVARCVYILDGPLLSAAANAPLANSSVFVLTPPVAVSEGESIAPVHGLQVNFDVGAAPAGKFLVHLWSQSSTAAGAESNLERMKATMSKMSKPFGNEEGPNPTVLAVATYLQRIRQTEHARFVPPPPPQQQQQQSTSAAAAGSAAELAAPQGSLANVPAVAPSPDGIYISSDPSSTLSLALDSCLIEAQALYAALFPSYPAFHEAMKGKEQEKSDEELALLQQLEHKQETVTDPEEEQKGQQQEQQQEEHHTDPASEQQQQAEQPAQQQAEQQLQQQQQIQADAASTADQDAANTRS